MKEREQFCDWCGEPLGKFARYPGDFLSCGQQECNRAERDHHEARREQIIEEALEREGYGQW